jgi:hypothetical protein
MYFVIYTPILITLLFSLCGRNTDTVARTTSTYWCTYYRLVQSVKYCWCSYYRLAQSLYYYWCSYYRLVQSVVLLVLVLQTNTASVLLLEPVLQTGTISVVLLLLVLQTSTIFAVSLVLVVQTNTIFAVCLPLVLQTSTISVPLTDQHNICRIPLLLVLQNNTICVELGNFPDARSLLQFNPTLTARSFPYRLPISRCQVRSAGVECARNAFLDPGVSARWDFAFAFAFTRTSRVHRGLHRAKRQCKVSCFRQATHILNMHSSLVGTPHSHRCSLLLSKQAYSAAGPSQLHLSIISNRSPRTKARNNFCNDRNP